MLLKSALEGKMLMYCRKVPGIIRNLFEVNNLIKLLLQKKLLETKGIQASVQWA
jgi:hypothetical protein